VTPWRKSGDPEVDLGELTHSSLFIPSTQALTGAFHQSDRLSPLLGFGSGKLPGSSVFGLWCCWSVLGKGVLLSFVEVLSSPSVRGLKVFLF
jgi:hypothetical protein